MSASMVYDYTAWQKFVFVLNYFKVCGIVCQKYFVFKLPDVLLSGPCFSLFITAVHVRIFMYTFQLSCRQITAYPNNAIYYTWPNEVMFTNHSFKWHIQQILKIGFSSFHFTSSSYETTNYVIFTSLSLLNKYCEIL